MLIPTTEPRLDPLSSVLGQGEDKREKPGSPLGLCVKVSELGPWQLSRPESHTVLWLERAQIIPKDLQEPVNTGNECPGIVL